MKLRKYGSLMILLWGIITIMQITMYGLGAGFAVFMAFLIIWTYQIEVN